MGTRYINGKFTILRRYQSYIRDMKIRFPIYEYNESYICNIINTYLYHHNNLRVVFINDFPVCGEHPFPYK